MSVLSLGDDAVEELAALVEDDGGAAGQNPVPWARADREPGLIVRAVYNLLWMTKLLAG